MATQKQKDFQKLGKQVSDNIIRIGKDHGHTTVGKIAAFCEIKANTLEGKLSCPLNFRLEELYAISRAYHVTLGELLCEERM